MIHEITAQTGKYKARKRIGRGPGSGSGKTAGRGHKGAKSRSGWSGSQHPLYEGGQMPYFRRIPKRGFSNAAFRRDFAVVNVKTLEANFDDGAAVNLDALAAKHLVPGDKLPLKILGEGELTKKLTVTAGKFSAAARQKIENAGGTAILADPAAEADAQPPAE
jgi:large subunit ribosomal protein L15